MQSQNNPLLIPSSGEKGGIQWISKEWCGVPSNKRRTSMSEQRTDQLSEDIIESLARLSSIPFERCIFRVQDQLRKVNVNAYEPEVVAIGPYHHGKYKLQLMEEHKLRYLQQFLERRNETNVLRYTKAMRDAEEEARKLYAEPISSTSDEFVKMMLLDSCFIVELLRKYKMMELIDKDDPIFQFPHIRSGIRRDLLLVENQLPFFILVKFFRMTKIFDPRDEIIGTSLEFFGPEKLRPIEDVNVILGEEILQDQKHLLGLVHYCWCYPLKLMPMTGNVAHDEVIVEQSSTESQALVWHINSATELQKAGIKFKKAEEGTSFVIKFVIGTMKIPILRVSSMPEFNFRLITSTKFLKVEKKRKMALFDVGFKNGTMEIPPLRVSSNTESIFRNLIAHEQFLSGIFPRCFTDYAIFMDYLISSPKDVEILRYHGIIHWFIGDDELVCTMLNKIGHNTKPSHDFHYAHVFRKVDENCRKPWNNAKVSLRQDYFNTPWAFLSFLAAVVLLLLTATQTVFSILSFV